MAFSCCKTSYHHLKDKPFGEEIVKTAVLSEETITHDPEDNYAGRGFNCRILNNGASNLVAGKQYTVVFNGVEYQCEAYTVLDNCVEYEYVAIGSIAAHDVMYKNDTIDTGEPFWYGESEYRTDIGWIGDETCTFAIYEVTEVVKTLDPKYLPEGAGGSGGLNAVIFRLRFNGNTPVLTCNMSGEEFIDAVFVRDVVDLVVLNASRDGSMELYLAQSSGFDTSSDVTPKLPARVGFNNGKATFNTDGTLSWEFYD